MPQSRGDPAVAVIHQIFQCVIGTVGNHGFHRVRQHPVAAHHQCGGTAHGHAVEQDTDIPAVDLFQFPAPGNAVHLLIEPEGDEVTLRLSVTAHLRHQTVISHPLVHGKEPAHIPDVTAVISVKRKHHRLGPGIHGIEVAPQSVSFCRNDLHRLPVHGSDLLLRLFSLADIIPHGPGRRLGRVLQCPAVSSRYVVEEDERAQQDQTDQCHEAEENDSRYDHRHAPFFEIRLT